MPTAKVKSGRAAITVLIMEHPGGFSVFKKAEAVLMISLESNTEAKNGRKRRNPVFLGHHKKELEERFSVRRIGLFGSVIHGAEDGGSDVDILVELDQSTFDHYMDLKFFLEDSLGQPVDFVLADSLKPRLKSAISSEVAYA
jgi:hypothetical protein